MDLLYPDIINYIGGFLCDSDLSNVSQTCKKHSETLFKTLQKRKRDKIERIRKTFPDWLIELVSIEKFITMPCLEWRKEWLGHTDYIDSIKRGVSKLPMWYTIDQYRRSAIIVDIKAVVYHCWSRGEWFDPLTILWKTIFDVRRLQIPPRRKRITRCFNLRSS